MLRTIGFRRLLPALNMALFAAAFCIGSVGGSDTRHESATRDHVVETGTFPAYFKIAVSLNLPAVLTALVVNATVFHFRTSCVPWLVVPLIPLFWFPVGKWFDRRLDWVHRCKPKRTFVRDALAVASGILAILVFLVLLQVVRVVKQGYSGSPDGFWIVLGVCAWFAFVLVVLARMLYSRFLRKPDIVTATSP